MSKYIVTFIPMSHSISEAMPRTEAFCAPQWQPGQRETIEILRDQASAILGERAWLLEVRSPDAGAGLTHAPHAGYSGLDTRSNW